ncbi:Acyltransferase domain-containing protein [Sulfidibacter corallicola]|uniref:Acyltransferase domain-containing protein n=1 Tax=Sulfidibacter corallicola TaxID=2818388 RepID=A0A8A4TTA0_SULCO|nr:type I polyketide synthase [Sulfidibacter corallicola]QTD52272.1 acyltransferase domain-containing protein [Sulfidibacter corallicola]
MSHDHELEFNGGIAVVGMACRFPGANDVHAFWRNLKEGAHGITFFEDVAAAGFPEDTQAQVVPARGLLHDIDAFDAEAFGLSARDALLMDPQQRLLLETAQHALDDAGLDPAVAGHGMGVFTGVGSGSYVQRLWDDPAIRASAGALQLEIGNDKDYSAPRLSYLLNLRGPSVPVQTACSTSLVAVHMACQSLLSRECDTALAGGASVPYLEPIGYLYQEDGIYSPDGFCRTFDEAANGTVPGSGVGLVVLKRLEDAQAAGDRILAVIAATAINNDGADKVGFTAPSVAGQRDVIEEALAVADADPGQVGYVEAHGTATNLGDPIEIEALRQAFGGLPSRSCALGAVKTNIGHAGAAAGIAGLIKTVLCRHHDTLVPSLHFHRPNPKLELGRGPFYVNTETREWPADKPLAGVSSFGIGGTNCHLVLGPAPDSPDTARPSARAAQLLVLSACDADPLVRHAASLAGSLEAPDAPDLADVAFSLNGARRGFDTRSWVVASSREEAAERLRAGTLPKRSLRSAQTPAVVFCFSGQGVSVGDWGAELYREEPVFRQAADEASRALAPHLGLDLAARMFGADPGLQAPSLFQPALFTLGYALASTWVGLGVQPAAVMGHSVGEIAASVIAGVLTLSEAAALIACRGAETERLPSGSMVTLPISESEVADWLTPDLSLAAVNAPRLCVLSGLAPAVEAVMTRARDAGVEPILLPASHAFHSSMMEPALAPLTRTARAVRAKPPEIPMVSGLSGTWLTGEQATDPTYWAEHMSRPVRFHDGLNTAATLEGAIFLEIGPGHTLTRLVSRMGQGSPPALASLVPDMPTGRSFREALGALWAHGVDIDWYAWFDGERRRKVSLPGYPFARRSFWVAGQDDAPTRALLETRRPLSEWFYREAWKQVTLPVDSGSEPAAGPDGTWLLFLDEAPLADILTERLRAMGQTALLVRRGPAFRDTGDGVFELHPARSGDYEALLQHLDRDGRRPDHVIHGWSLGFDGPVSARNVDDGLELGFSSLVRLAKVLEEKGLSQVRLAVATRGMWRVGREWGSAGSWRASLLGAIEILPLEYDCLSCCCTDVGDATPEEAAEVILGRFAGAWDDETWVLAHGLVWRRDVVRVQAPALPERVLDGGVYLVVNAFQTLGYALCRWLQEQRATVVLVDRAFLPEPSDWDDWVREQGPDDWTRSVIENLRTLDRRFFVKTAAPDDARAMAAVVDAVVREHGALDGVFHLDRPSPASLFQRKSAADPAPILADKMRETYVLAEAFSDLDLWVTFTANRDEGGGIGQSEQLAGYAFQHAFAEGLPHSVARRSLVVEWGLSAQLEGERDGAGWIGRQLRDKQARFGLEPSDCLEILARLLASDWPHAVVSTRDYGAVLAQRKRFTARYFKDQATATAVTERPALTTEYVAARNDVERLLVELWEAAFAVRPVGAQDDFFELGGHSLLAVDLLANMGKVFSVNISLENLFANPTIAALGRVLSGDELEVEDAAGMEDLLDHIEGLSPEELEAMLAEVENEDS